MFGVKSMLDAEVLVAETTNNRNQLRTGRGKNEREKDQYEQPSKLEMVALIVYMTLVKLSLHVKVSAVFADTFSNYNLAKTSTSFVVVIKDD